MQLGLMHDVRGQQTLPSYSLRERTSGAIYAGVPTVDLGLECSRDDCTNKTNQRKKISHIPKRKTSHTKLNLKLNL